MSHKRSLILLATLATLLLLVTTAAGSGYTLFGTVDGGGGLSSGANGYVVHGTAGQPDHITFSGGSYALYAGFWHPVMTSGIPTAVSVARTTIGTPVAQLALLTLLGSMATVLLLLRDRRRQMLP